MNRFKLIIGVALVFVVGIFAGVIGSGLYYKEYLKNFDAGGPPMDARIRMLLDRFSQDLELTNIQKVEIEKILRDVQNKIFEMRRETFPEIEEINEKGLDLIKEKLDSKQRQKFNSFHNKMKGLYDTFAVKLDFPGRPPEPDIDEIKDLLGLTPEQVSEIEKIMEDGFNEREKIMEENRRKQAPDFSLIRQKMMDSENVQRKRIEETLTAEQLEVYRKHMEERQFRKPPGRPPGPSGGSPPAPAGGLPPSPGGRLY